MCTDVLDNEHFSSIIGIFWGITQNKVNNIIHAGPPKKTEEDHESKCSCVFFSYYIHCKNQFADVAIGNRDHSKLYQ